MSETFYIKIRGKTFGPFAQEHVQDMITNGKLGANGEISKDRLNWGTVADYRCFAINPFVGGETTGNHVGASRDRASYRLDIAETEGEIGFPPRQGQWFYSLDGDVGFGPYPESTIITLIRAGQIPANTLVWQKDGVPEAVFQTETFAQYLPQPKSRGRTKKKDKPTPAQTIDNGVRVSDELANPVIRSQPWVLTLTIMTYLLTIVCMLQTVVPERRSTTRPVAWSETSRDVGDDEAIAPRISFGRMLASTAVACLAAVLTRYCRDVRRFVNAPTEFRLQRVLKSQNAALRFAVVATCVFLLVEHGRHLAMLLL